MSCTTTFSRFHDYSVALQALLANHQVVNIIQGGVTEQGRGLRAGWGGSYTARLAHIAAAVEFLDQMTLSLMSSIAQMLTCCSSRYHLNGGFGKFR